MNMPNGSSLDNGSCEPYHRAELDVEGGMSAAALAKPAGRAWQ